MASSPRANGSGRETRRSAASTRAVSSVGENGLTRRSAAPAFSAWAIVSPRPVSGDEDHRQVGQLGNASHQLDAIGAGQHEAEEDQVRAPAADGARQLRVVAVTVTA